MTLSKFELAVGPSWRKWSRARARALVAKGLRKSTARKMAAAEAIAREKIEVLFGSDAATEIDVAIGIRADGSTGIFVGGMIDDLPAMAVSMMPAIMPEAAFGLR